MRVSARVAPQLVSQDFVRASCFEERNVLHRFLEESVVMLEGMFAFVFF